jgi:hypothetical protein
MAHRWKTVSLAYLQTWKELGQLFQILDQAEAAIVILQMFYPEYDHKLIYNTI